MKLKAFTIAELVVGMLLTSLVAGLAYHCFFLFQRQFTQLSERVSNNNEYLLLRKALQTDIDRADAVLDSTGSILMQPQNVLYTFSNSSITRTQRAVTDSFRMQLISMDVQRVNNMVSQIKLQLQNNSLLFTKIYSAEQLMNE